MKNAWLLILTLLLAGSACGKKADPRAPERIARGLMRG